MKYIKIIFMIIIIILASTFMYIGWLSMDGDGDGLINGTEQGGWDIQIYYANGSVEKRHVNSDPNSRDTDGDGLSDSEEFAYIGSLDPSSRDTDRDGISDYDEIKTYDTLPNYQDSEPLYKDGLMDGIEINGWNITIKGETRHVKSDPFTYNSDGDELSDYEEWNGSNGFRTDPESKDTDGDDISDGSDINPIWNVKIKVELLNFTLLSSPGNTSRPYFHIRVGSNSTETEKLPSLSAGEKVELNESVYVLDISDYEGNFPPEIIIYAFDNNTQETRSTIFGTITVDVSLDINGSKSSWTGHYTDYPNEQIFKIQGTDGILFFKVSTVDE